MALKDELPELIGYLRKRFNSADLRIAMHPKKADMAEVYIGDEFVAPLYREEDEGEVSYQLQMVILDLDLEDTKDA